MRRKLWHFVSFGGPAFAIYTCFVLLPIVVSVGYSLTNYNPFNPPTRWVGLRNYHLLLDDSEFLTSLRVTTILTMMVVIVPNVLGLGIAVLLDRRGWFYNAMRSVFFLPMVLSSVVVSVIWTRLLDNEGLLSQTLRALGVSDPPGWLSDPRYALYSLGSIVSWQMLGFCVVVYLAGLQGVPAQLMEAAAIDGAGPFQRFWRVTWPLLAPALTVNTVILLISAKLHRCFGEWLRRAFLDDDALNRQALHYEGHDRCSENAKAGHGITCSWMFSELPSLIRIGRAAPS